VTNPGANCAMRLRTFSDMIGVRTRPSRGLWWTSALVGKPTATPSLARVNRATTSLDGRPIRKAAKDRIDAVRFASPTSMFSSETNGSLRGCPRPFTPPTGDRLRSLGAARCYPPESGATAVTRRHHCKSAFEVTIDNPTGCGDVFNAAYVRETDGVPVRSRCICECIRGAPPRNRRVRPNLGDVRRFLRLSARRRQFHFRASPLRRRSYPKTAYNATWPSRVTLSIRCILERGRCSDVQGSRRTSWTSHPVRGPPVRRRFVRGDAGGCAANVVRGTVPEMWLWTRWRDRNDWMCAGPRTPSLSFDISPRVLPSSEPMRARAPAVRGAALAVIALLRQYQHTAAIPLPDASRPRRDSKRMDVSDRALRVRWRLSLGSSRTSIEVSVHTRGLRARVLESCSNREPRPDRHMTIGIRCGAPARRSTSSSVVSSPLSLEPVANRRVHMERVASGRAEVRSDHHRVRQRVRGGRTPAQPVDERASRNGFRRMGADRYSRNSALSGVGLGLHLAGIGTLDTSPARRASDQGWGGFRTRFESLRWPSRAPPV